MDFTVLSPGEEDLCHRSATSTHRHCACVQCAELTSFLSRGCKPRCTMGVLCSGPVRGACVMPGEDVQAASSPYTICFTITLLPAPPPTPPPNQTAPRGSGQSKQAPHPPALSCPGTQFHQCAAEAGVRTVETHQVLRLQTNASRFSSL